VTTTSALGRHPLIVFFVLAYLISWTSFIVLGGPFLFPFGSILAAIIVLTATEGRKGLKDFAGRCFRWRVPIVCYFAAILVPAAIALIAVSLSLGFGGVAVPALNPFSIALLLYIPMAAVDAPLWEDSGWRGYAMPRFPADRSRAFNTAILGLILAGWHLPLALSSGSIAIPYVISTFFSAFVTNWIYYHSRQSALLAILYHSVANAMLLMLFKARPDEFLLPFFWSLAAANFVATTIILLTDRKFWFETPDNE